MKRFFLVIGLTLGMGMPTAALTPKSPSIALFLSPKDAASAVLPDLEKQLHLSRRFVVMPSSVSLLAMPATLEAAIPRIKQATKADLALVGTVSSKNKVIKMEGRVYDLVLNDVSKLLRFEGGADDAILLASQLTNFLKSRNPLKGEILGMQDELVLLNMGAEDGVDAGSFYDVLPPVGSDPKPLGRIKILKTEAWFSTATTQFIKKGVHFKPGDVAVEDVAAQHLQ